MSVKTITALVTSAGVASAINVIKALRLSKEFVFKIIAFDLDKLAPGLYLADEHYISPPISETKRYLDFLFDICKKHDVHVMFPIYSKEISLIASKKEDFLKAGIHILLPSKKTIDLCNDKLAMQNAAALLQIPTPKNITNPTVNDLPIFSKLLSGSGSSGAQLISDEVLLSYYKQLNENRIYQEYIKGEEITVDVLCNKSSQALCICPRKRISVKSGQCVKGETIHDQQINNYVRQICTALEYTGVCNMQFIKKDYVLYFIEINPRFSAGGLMLTVHAGANLPLLAVKVMLDIPIADSELHHKEHVFMTRYWEEIIFEGKA